MGNMRKLREKAMCLLISTVMIASSCSAAAFAAEWTESEWARAEVSEAVQEGLVPESIQGDYQKAITRQELAELMAYYLLWHEPRGTDLDGMWQRWAVKYGDMGESYTASEYVYKENVFSDTNDEILNRLYQFDIINGFEDGTYRPDQSISRQDAAAIFWEGLSRYIGDYHGGGYSMYTASNTWKDYNQIGSWATAAASNLLNCGCMKGVAEDLFAPGESISREQAVIISLRMTKAESDNLYSQRKNHDIFSFSYDEAIDLFDNAMITNLDTGKSKEITEKETLGEIIRVLQSVHGDVVGWKPDYPDSGYSIRLHQKYHASEDYLVGPSGYEPYGFVADAQTGRKIYYESYEMQAYDGQGIDISRLEELLNA